MPHDEEEHTEVQAAEKKVSRRVAKKRRRVRVSGTSVFLLSTLLRRGRTVRRSPKRRRPRR